MARRGFRGRGFSVFQKVKTGSGAHPAAYLTETGGTSPVGMADRA